MNGNSGLEPLEGPTDAPSATRGDLPVPGEPTYNPGATPPKRKPWVAMSIVAVVVLLAVGLLGASLKAGGAGGLNPDNPNGAIAPNFKLPNLDGSGNFDFSSLRGKVVVLNFWASWCGPCKEEAPVLAAGYDKWGPKGVVFLGIDSQDSKAWAIQYEQKYGIHYSSVIDTMGLTEKSYGTTGFPETFFINTKGKIISKWIGPIDPQTLDSSIQNLLAAG